MKCVAVLSSSASDLGYRDVSLLSFKKKPSTTLMVLYILNLNCLNNPAKSVKILECVSYLACTIFCLFFPGLSRDVLLC